MAATITAAGEQWGQPGQQRAVGPAGTVAGKPGQQRAAEIAAGPAGTAVGKAGTAAGPAGQRAGVPPRRPIRRLRLRGKLRLLLRGARLARRLALKKGNAAGAKKGAK